MFLEEIQHGIEAIDLTGDNSDIIANLPEITDEEKKDLVGPLGDDLKRLFFFFKRLVMECEVLASEFKEKFEQADDEIKEALCESLCSGPAINLDIKVDACKSLFFASLRLEHPEIALADRVGVALLDGQVVVYGQKHRQCNCPACTLKRELTEALGIVILG